MATPLLRQLMTETLTTVMKDIQVTKITAQLLPGTFSLALVFYPVTAASNQYVLGIPLWDKAIINLSSGKQLTILAQPNAPSTTIC